MATWGKVLAVGGCRGGFREERPGLHTAGSRWFQPAPADPLQLSPAAKVVAPQ